MDSDDDERGEDEDDFWWAVGMVMDLVMIPQGNDGILLAATLSTANASLVLEAAAILGRVDVVAALLGRPDVDPCSCLVPKSRTYNSDVLWLFVQDTRVKHALPPRHARSLVRWFVAYTKDWARTRAVWQTFAAVVSAEDMVCCAFDELRVDVMAALLVDEATSDIPSYLLVERRHRASWWRSGSLGDEKKRDMVSLLVQHRRLVVPRWALKAAGSWADVEVRAMLCSSCPGTAAVYAAVHNDADLLRTLLRDPALKPKHVAALRVHHTDAATRAVIESDPRRHWVDPRSIVYC
jgi:hypothetical protein